MLFRNMRRFFHLIIVVCLLLVTGCGISPLDKSALKQSQSIAPQKFTELNNDDVISTKSQESSVMNPNVCAEDPNQESTGVFINVAVATLWSEPNQDRSMDDLARQNPSEIGSWTVSMSMKDKLWLVGKLETQALFGQRVEVLTEKGAWAKIAVNNQSTSKNNKGYPGWVPKIQLTSKSSHYEKYARCGTVLVKKPTAWLYSQPSDSEPFFQISFNTRLPLLEEVGEWVAVATPDLGNKWLQRKDIIVETSDAIPRKIPSGAEIVTTAKNFLNLPYLWAGISGFGFDCSGFTSTVYQFYGISIPRDASDQFMTGTKVKPNELLPGDLLFYAYDHGKGKVHHVSMYIGDGLMIHSPKTERAVEIIPIQTSEYAQEFAGARRILVRDDLIKKD